MYSDCSDACGWCITGGKRPDGTQTTPAIRRATTAWLKSADRYPPPVGPLEAVSILSEDGATLLVWVTRPIDEGERLTAMQSSRHFSPVSVRSGAEVYVVRVRSCDDGCHEPDAVFTTRAAADAYARTAHRGLGIGGRPVAFVEPFTLDDPKDPRRPQSPKEPA